MLCRLKRCCEAQSSIATRVIVLQTCVLSMCTLLALKHPCCFASPQSQEIKKKSIIEIVCATEVEVYPDSSFKAFLPEFCLHQDIER